jgi:hypothetical protein
MNGMALVKTGLLAALGLGFLVTRLLAGESKETTQDRGTLTALNGGDRLLQVRTGSSGEVQTYHWDQSTGFYDVDGPIVPETLQVGQRVLVVYAKKRDIALRVEVEPVFNDQAT